MRAQLPFKLRPAFAPDIAPERRPEVRPERRPERRPEPSPQAGELRAAGLHVTLPRLMVLRTLAECPADAGDAPARTVSGLHRLMESLGRTVPLPSLYRVLRDLHAVGLARQVALPASRRAGERAGGATDVVKQDARDGVAPDGRVDVEAHHGAA